MKPFAKQFYMSKAWKDCRLSFMQSKFFCCERCDGAATIAHHKTYLTPGNIDDPNTTLNWELLEAVCNSCHNLEHLGSSEVVRNGFYFTESGEFVRM